MNQDEFLEKILSEPESTSVTLPSNSKFEIFVLNRIDKIFAVNVGGDYQIVDSYSKLWEIYQAAI
jgi:hypothetical protein